MDLVLESYEILPDFTDNGSPGALLAKTPALQGFEKRVASTDSLLGLAPLKTDAKPRKVDVENAPDWLKRPYVHTGYLIGGTPMQATISTLFGFNNETLNAWTMVWTSMLSTYLFLLARRDHPADIVPFFLLWLSNVAHMPLSVGLHCTIGVSWQQRSVWRSLDVGGIFTASLILAAAMGWHVFTSRLQYGAYLACCLVAYAHILWSTMVARRICDISKRDTARYVACMVTMHALPLLFALARELAAEQRPGPVARTVAAIAATMVVGGELYARHIPERLLPGCFDLLGNSHQLMHLLATLAHYLEYRLLTLLATQQHML